MSARGAKFRTNCGNPIWICVLHRSKTRIHKTIFYRKTAHQPVVRLFAPYGSRDDEGPMSGCETWRAKDAIDGNGALRFDHHRSCPSLVRSPSLAGTRSLTLARSDRPRLRYGDDLATELRLGGCLRWKERLSCPLSCRWRSDQHPCCPSLTIGGIRDRRFQCGGDR